MRDPHGLVIVLVASPGDTRSGWDGAAGVPTEHVVRGLHSVTLSEAQLEPTQRMLSELFGMSLTQEYGGRSSFTMAGNGAASVIDVAAETEPRACRPCRSVRPCRPG